MGESTQESTFFFQEKLRDFSLKLRFKIDYSFLLISFLKFINSNNRSDYYSIRQWITQI